MSTDWFKNRDKQVEARVAMVLSERNNDAPVSWDGEAGWDITIHTSIPFRVEIKADWKYLLFGNLCFETRNIRQNKPSGIVSTKANVWAHYVPQKDALLLFEPAKKLLAHLCERYRAKDPAYPLKKKMGDGNSQGLIVPYDVISTL